MASEIFTKGKDEYIFSEAVICKEVASDELLTVADWTNNDITFDNSLFEQISLKPLLEKHNLDSHLNEGGITRAIGTIQSDIAKIIKDYQGRVRFSTLPTDRDYRVYITIDYRIAKAIRYFSRGLPALPELGVNLLTGSKKSFLDTYTYTKHEYEFLDCTAVNLVIEERIP